jgi:hypothetical protein
MLKRFFTAALLLSAIPAHAADWEGVYEGTLGRAKVIVELVEPLDDMEGESKREASRYSYLPKVRDLNLMFAGSDKTLGFDETTLMPYQFASDEDKKITGHWTLTPSAHGAKGTWASPDGKKKLPIILVRVENIPEEKADPDLNIMSATYNELWLKQVSFTDAGVAKSFGDVEVRFVKDSAFGITYPVLGVFPDELRKAAANDLLMAAHRRSVAQYRDCKNGVPVAWEAENPEAEMSNEVNYATATLLSFSESGSVFCGGAHPNNYLTPITYDLTAPAQMGGKYQLDLSPDGFGRVLKLATKDERIAFERFALGRWKDAAGQDKEMGADCGGGWMEESPEGERDFKLSFTAQGLAVTRTDFPHVASACLFSDFNPTIIPWADLKRWLKEGQNLLNTEVK